MKLPKDGPFDPTIRLLRQFALIWIVFFGAIALVQELHHHRHAVAAALAILAVTVGPIGLLWPRMLRPIFIGWMLLAFPIGWVVSKVVLGTVFYGLLTPVGLFFRLMGRDVLRLRPNEDSQTYWHPKATTADKAKYLRQF